MNTKENFSNSIDDFKNTNFDWYNIERPDTAWLVDGLITSDGTVAVCGKPKAGKSSLVRHLVACVIKGGKFLDRTIDILPGTGKVLYVHLDRKDQPWRVSEEFKKQGITKAQAERLVFRTEDHINGPENDERAKRLNWLKREVVTNQPHLVVIDLLWQFLNVPNANAYKEVLDGINQLQDALRSAGYKGATLVTMHGRKASSVDSPADDILGSTAQRGSFSTILMLARNRKEDFYTIISDQTDRDDVYGEIDERLLQRDASGVYSLGPLVSDLRAQEADAKIEADLIQLLNFIGEQNGCDMEAILKGVKMSEKYVRKLMKRDGNALIRVEGGGKKSDPYRYFVDCVDKCGLGKQ